MKYLFVLIFLVFSVPAFAKRLPPPVVEPLEYNGIRYTAHYARHVAYLEAWDIQGGKLLWTAPVFRNLINPLLEEDVQIVFINKLEVDQNVLVVTSERGRIYHVDLKSGHVERSIWLRILVVVILAIVLLFGVRWIKKSRRAIM